MSACGFRSFCSRPVHHRGHHGGWRTGATAVADDPVFREPETLGHELTARELQVIAESVVHGRYSDVATCLGISGQTVKNHASSALAKTGASSITNIAYLLGWVTLPAGVGHLEGAA